MNGFIYMHIYISNSRKNAVIGTAKKRRMPNRQSVHSANSLQNLVSSPKVQSVCMAHMGALWGKLRDQWILERHPRRIGAA